MATKKSEPKTESTSSSGSTKRDTVIKKLELMRDLTNPASKKSETVQDIFALVFKNANEALDILK
jgi:hypothetical protein